MSTADGYYREVASPEEVSSSYAAARRVASDEGEEELELGLSLGAKKSGGGGRAGSSSAPWRRHCRILTANDFPSMVPPEVASNTPSQVVGWPPIRAYRINSLFGHSKHGASETNGASRAKDPIEHTSSTHHKGTKNKGSKESAATSKDRDKKHSSSHFVKVNMDGALIGRKVDLNAHRSYDSLALALEDMFQKPTGLKALFRSRKASKLLDGSSEFVLTYEDKDGDWMLVGDVPWGSASGGIFLGNDNLCIFPKSNPESYTPAFKIHDVPEHREEAENHEDF